MPPKTESKKARLRAYLESERPPAITESIWRGLLDRLAPISESYLRELLHAAGVPIQPPYGGVRQKSFEELEASLLELEAVYTEARAAGDPQRARYCRRLVIAAKDRARAAMRKHPEKDEMVEWMLVWLENPSVFREWVRVKKTGRAGLPATESPPSRP